LKDPFSVIRRYELIGIFPVSSTGGWSNPVGLMQPIEQVGKGPLLNRSAIGDDQKLVKSRVGIVKPERKP